MDNKLQQSACGEEIRYISTIEELSSYLNDNRQVAAAMVRAIANQAATDGSYPIQDILEKGYEDSLYLDDLMGLDEEFRAIVMTPMIETATDWGQPFSYHNFGIRIMEFLEDIEVSEEIASDFEHCLRWTRKTGQLVKWESCS